MRWLYTALFYLMMPFIMLRMLFRARNAPAYLNRWGERFGFYSATFPKGVIWFHAVSVGEAEAAFPLIQSVQQQYPKADILVTTTTPTGSARVKAFLGHRVHHVYLPYDLPDAVWRFLRHFEPKIGIILETEIWPNLLFQAKKRHIPTIIVNARMSAKSAKGYAKLGDFTADVFQQISTICAQTEASAQRFVELGASKENVCVPGNMKFDVEMPALLNEQAEVIRRDWFSQRSSWIAASTHQGEDEHVLAAFKQIKASIPHALLVLVPRHPERFDEVTRLCERMGFSVQRRTQLSTTVIKEDVFLLDTMGELKTFYAAADVAFVGGSLVETGGHNLLEPAALGLPIVFGPHMFNFAEISERLLKKKAAVQVDEAGLADAVQGLLSDAQVREQMGQAGIAFVQQNQGAVDRVLDVIVRFLDD